MTDCTSCVMERWGKLRVLVGNWTLLQASELGVNLAAVKPRRAVGAMAWKWLLAPCFRFPSPRNLPPVKEKL